MYDALKEYRASENFHVYFELQTSVVQCISHIVFATSFDIALIIPTWNYAPTIQKRVVCMDIEQSTNYYWSHLLHYCCISV